MLVNLKPLCPSHHGENAAVDVLGGKQLGTWCPEVKAPPGWRLDSCFSLDFLIMTGLTPLEGDRAPDEDHLRGEGALQGECLPHPDTEEVALLSGGKVPSFDLSHLES